MPNGDRTLDQIERWMQAVIMHPGGVVEGVTSTEARRHIAVDPAGLETVVTRSRALDASDRLAIYNRAYFARLLECLRDEYPVLVQTVTEEIFDEFALGYLQAYPSCRYTLNRLGADFSRYLAETWPGSEKEDEPSLSWPDFLVDLARLEWTFNEVFDGPGTENEPPLDVERLTSLPLERWPRARLVGAPCLRLLELCFAVHKHYRAIRAGEEPAVPTPAETYLAVTRQHYVVRHYPLSRDEFDLLRLLVAGEPVGAAIETVFGQARIHPDDFSERLGDWFRRWSAERFITAVELPT